MGFLMNIRILFRHLTVVLAALLAVGTFLSGCSGIKIERPLRLRDGDWPTFAGSPSRTALADQTIIPPLVQQWELDVTAGIGNGSPLMVDSTLLIGNLRGELVVADGRTGKRIGWIKLGDAIQGSPVVDGSMVFVAVSNSNESLLAFDLRDGKIKWKQAYGDIEVSPLLLNQRLYFGNIDGDFFCVQPVNGNVVWKYQIPENKLHDGFRSSPAGKGSIIVVGGENGIVYGFDAEKGTVRWTFKTGADLFGTPSIADSLLFIGNSAGTMFALELQSGRMRWRFDTGSPIYGNAAVADSTVFFGNLAGALLALHATSGAELWRNTLGSPINSGPAVAGGYLYIGTLKKFLFAVRVKDGSIAWSHELNGRVKTSPAAVYGQLLVATDDWVILSFKGSAE
jgi:outer membrane protein assembly factor BamB